MGVRGNIHERGYRKAWECFGHVERVGWKLQHKNVYELGVRVKQVEESSQLCALMCSAGRASEVNGATE